LTQVQVQYALQGSDVRVLSAAERPKSPSSPNPARNLILAVLLGLLGGGAIAFLRAAPGDKVVSVEILERELDPLPVVGAVPDAEVDPVPGGLPLASREPGSAFAESIRSVRASVQFLGLRRHLRTILVTSPSFGEGKTVTCANLAVAFATSGRQVAVVDANLRHPGLHHHFGVTNDKGLSELLTGQSDLEEARVLVELPTGEKLTLLCAGPVPPNPAEVLSSPALPALLQELGDEFDVVLVDGAPLVPVVDSQLLSAWIDGVIVVSRIKRTQRNALRRALLLCRQANADVLGVVVVGAQRLESYDDGRLGGPTTASGSRFSRLRARRSAG
jgi:capsular exopolysaccharide synthesis family protein